MLQQTQVKTVIPYFKKFTKKFPTLQSLSKSNEKQILKMWEGLGYYRRARNLFACSKQLIILYGGKLPKTLDEIKKLPGIGDYTGSALLGLVYDQPRIAVDGNVRRVFARNLNKKEAKIDFIKLVNSNSKMLFINKRNADFVEALMEFGALICRPKNPKCFVCCLNKTCKYFKSSKKIITTSKKMFKTKNYDIFCFLNNKKQIALTKKNNLGFLKNFNLPMIKETNKNNIRSWKLLNNYYNSISNLKLNINLYYKFSSKIPAEYNWHSLDDKKEFRPSFTKKYLDKFQIYFNEKKNSNHWCRYSRINSCEFIKKTYRS